MPEAKRSACWILAAVLAFAAAALFAAPVWAKAARETDGGRRVALVVGNHAYRSVPPLKNAVNDSDAVAAALKDLGFEVTAVADIDLPTFRFVLDGFEQAADGAEAVVFYYSGHGFQLNGINYLVPVDARLRDRKAVEAETLRLDEIIRRLSGRDRQTLVFLDACRDNPLPERLRAEAGQGLAQIETGTGTFVAFATQPGNVAFDGAGEHSYFTGALLDNIDTPGISISDMMIRVRNQVEKQTDHQQTPWDQSSLRAQFYFMPEQEESAALTDEDRELLKALDPELRKKFESRFGIRIDEAFAETEDGGESAPADAEGSAPIVPNIVVQDVAPESASQAARRTEEKPSLSASVAAPAPAGGVQASLRIIDLEDAAPEPVQPGQAVPASPDLGSAVPLPETRPQAAPPARPAGLAPAPTRPLPARPADQPRIAVAAAPPPATPAAPAGHPASAPTAPAPASTVPAAKPPAVTPAASAETLARAEIAPPPEIGGRSADGGVALSAPIAATLPEKPANPNRLAPLSGAADIVAAASGAVTVASGGAGETLRPAERSIDRVIGQEVTPELVGGEAIPEPRPVQPEASPSEAEMQLAAVEPGASGAAEVLKPEIGAAPAPTQLPNPGPEQGQEKRRDEMVRAIQAELKRLGCYRSGIDGDWGSGSAKGLLRYYATKKEAPDDLEPTQDLLTRLTDEPGVVCQRTETSVRTASARPEKPSGASRSSVRKATVRAADNDRARRNASGGGSGGGGSAGAKKTIKKITGIGGF